METVLIQSEFNVFALEQKSLCTSVCVEGSVVRLAKKSSFGNFSLSCGLRKVKFCQGKQLFGNFTLFHMTQFVKALLRQASSNLQNSVSLYYIQRKEEHVVRSSLGGMSTSNIPKKLMGHFQKSPWLSI